MAVVKFSPFDTIGYDIQDLKTKNKVSFILNRYIF